MIVIEITLAITGVLIALTTLLEKFSKTMKPFSKFFRTIGKMMFADFVNKLNELDFKIDKMEEDNDWKDIVNIRHKISDYASKLRKEKTLSETEYNLIWNYEIRYERYKIKYKIKYPNELKKVPNGEIKNCLAYIHKQFELGKVQSDKVK